MATSEFFYEKYNKFSINVKLFQGRLTKDTRSFFSERNNTPHGMSLFSIIELEGRNYNYKWKIGCRAPGASNPAIAALWLYERRIEAFAS